MKHFEVNEDEMKRWIDGFKYGTEKDKEAWLDRFVRGKEIMDKADEKFGKTTNPCSEVPIDIADYRPVSEKGKKLGLPPLPASPAPMKIPKFLDNPMEIL